MKIQESKLLGLPHSDVHFIVKNFTKTYPSKTVLIEYSEGFYKRLPGFEPTLKAIPKGTPSTTSDPDRSIRRTKTLISDIVLSTQFDMFATFTFSQDRDNVALSKTKMSNWLKSQQKIHGKFLYLIVSEYHKDKKSIHFHALLKNYKGKLISSEKYINGRLAYNIKSYKSGFSTVIKIDNVEKVSNYVKKYITKDMITIHKSKRYWSSKGLKRPKITYNIDTNSIQKLPQYATEYFTISEIEFPTKSGG